MYLNLNQNISNKSTLISCKTELEIFKNKHLASH